MKNPVTGLIELADQIVIEAATEGSSVSILHEVMERAETQNTSPPRWKVPHPQQRKFMIHSFTAGTLRWGNS